MTQVLRSACFETNSSSSHSITIAKHYAQYREGDILVTDFFRDSAGNPHEKCVILTGGQFGWEQNSYDDALTKANYLAVALHRQPADHPQRVMFERVLKEVTGARSIVYDMGDDYGHPNWSYIDHQSSGVPYEALLSEENLRKFLFNPRSVLTTDNDNH